jgi:hypothetical protein
MLAAEDGRVEFGTTVGVDSQTFRVQPIGHLDVGAPGVVGNVLDNFECGLAQFQIPSPDMGRVLVQSSDVSVLVDGVLESSERALPVVLVSQDSKTGDTLCNVKEMNRRLTGLAHVYEIDRDASFELTDRVGKVMSCFDGAVRLYWPGFARDGNHRRHTLYLAQRIRDLKKDGSLLRDKLFRILSNVASARFREGEIWRRLRKEADRARREELEQLREEAKGSEEDLDRIFDELFERNQRLRTERDELDDQVENLKAEIANYEENLEWYRQQLSAQSTEEPDGEEQQSPRKTGFGNVAEAVHSATKEFDGQLEVWSTARESAEESKFARPAEVYEALEAIAELAEEDRSGSVGPWSKFFEQRRIKYASGESEQTMAMHGEDRIFTDRFSGKRRQIEKHLTIGGGSRKNCVQIFFDRANDSDKFVIAYCGVHLPHAGRSS